jgi:hypothetical protein
MNTIFHNATRGNLYSITLEQDSLGYIIREFKHGNLQAYANLGHNDIALATDEYNRRIDEAAHYDQIYYVRKLV